jgi:ABC-2 type transport system permease protein
MYLIFKESSQENFVGYIVLGTGMMNLWSSIVFSAANQIDRERRMGTLEILNAVPTSFQTVIFGKIVGTVLVGLISTINGYVFIILISGSGFSIAHPGLFALNILIVIISYIGISIMLAALFALSREVRELINTAEFPVFILTGMIFPIVLLPLWTTPFSAILSPTWGVKLLRMCLFGIENQAEYNTAFIWLVGVTLFYLVGSVILYKRMMNSFRKSGSLGVV